MGHLNVELKARCSQPARVVARLLELGAESWGTGAQTDVYYRVPKGRLKLRRGGLENNLIHYDRDNERTPKESRVHLVPLDAEHALVALLDAALEHDVIVVKQRHILWCDNVKFHVDTVEGLGSFLEVEAIDYDGDRGSDALRTQCQEYMHLLGVHPDALEASSYSDMLRTHE